MKHGVIPLSSALLVAFFAAPLVARADANPNFDDDAKPILKMQPGLLQYVESRFEVKETGAAKYPGDDDRAPAPPYIFRARAVGSHGPYNLRLLIQPGPAGHILGVVDINKVHMNAPGNPGSGPSMANQPPPQEQSPQEPLQPSAAPAQPNPSAQVPELSEPPVAQQPPLNQAQAPAQQPQPAPQSPTAPTADTPSGPIMDSGSSNNGQNLAPPPDPAPPAQ
jgi:hypothetical protein